MKLDKRQLTRLRDLIQEKTGVFINDEKLESTYKRKLEEIARKNGYSDFEKFYLDIAKKRNQKLYCDIVSAVTINETYFFRESHQFEDLVKHVIPELHKKRHPEDTISILSAPCSTGEEIYSIAIYIMEECEEILKKRNFLLLGIDIDRKAIEKAKRGIFSTRSVHKLPERIREKYFMKTADGYMARSILKNAVNLEVVNVFDEKRMKKLGSFDVIFSRNMLIYFNEQDQLKVLEIFNKLLKRGGYLFLGHAEKVPPHLTCFTPIKIGTSYAYQKR